MAAKKKTKKHKQTKPKKTVKSKKKLVTKPAKKKLAKKKGTPKKALKKKTPKQTSAKKAAGNKKPEVKKAISTKTVGNPVEPAPRKSLTVNRFTSPREDRSASAGQSGDLQGLSRSERADSESVDELVEEGNAFEADAVAGVEEADDSDEREVHTHEVPEDDVPGEYLDED